MSVGVPFAVPPCVRTEGTPAELQRRRYLAVQRLAEGYSPEEVADLLGVAPRTVWRWWAAFRRHGVEGLATQPGPGPGRRPTLTATQAKDKAGQRERGAVAAALWLPPERDRLHLAYQTLVNGYFSNVAVAEFLSSAVQGLPGPVIALWDGGTMHKGGPIRALLEESQ